MDRADLTERRLSLLQEIAERADEISKIDIELHKSITGEHNESR
jgi:hypothetical protein